MPFEYARTLLVLGQLQRRRGERRSAAGSSQERVLGLALRRVTGADAEATAKLRWWSGTGSNG